MVKFINSIFLLNLGFNCLLIPYATNEGYDWFLLYPSGLSVAISLIGIRLFHGKHYKCDFRKNQIIYCNLVFYGILIAYQLISIINYSGKTDPTGIFINFNDEYIKWLPSSIEKEKTKKALLFNFIILTYFVLGHLVIKNLLKSERKNFLLVRYSSIFTFIYIIVLAVSKFVFKELNINLQNNNFFVYGANASCFYICLLLIFFKISNVAIFIKAISAKFYFGSRLAVTILFVACIAASKSSLGILSILLFTFIHHEFFYRWLKSKLLIMISVILLLFLALLSSYPNDPHRNFRFKNHRNDVIQEIQFGFETSCSEFNTGFTAFTLASEKNVEFASVMLRFGRYSNGLWSLKIENKLEGKNHVTFYKETRKSLKNGSNKITIRLIPETKISFNSEDLEKVSSSSYDVSYENVYSKLIQNLEHLSFSTVINVNSDTDTISNISYHFKLAPKNNYKKTYISSYDSNDYISFNYIDHLISDRLGLYKTTWNIFTSNLLFGIGGDCWPKAYQIYRTLGNASEAWCHSDFLQFFTEYGLALPFLILLTLGVSRRNNIQLSNGSDLLLCLLVEILPLSIFVFFDFPLHVHAIQFIIINYILLCANELNLKQLQLR